MIFIVYDLEATCWKGNPEELVQEIIEIGAFRLNNYGEVLGSYNRFVKPIINPFLSPYCKELTTIEQENVDKARKFPVVIEEFIEWAGVYDDEYLFCAWGKFDQKMIERDCKLHNIECDWLESHINLKRQYQDIHKLSYPIGLKTAVKREGLEFMGTQHRGIDDAENTVQIFKKHLDVWQF